MSDAAAAEAKRPPWLFPTRSLQFAALVAAFIVFSAVVASGATRGFDDPINRYAKSLQGHHAFDEAMLIMTTMGDVATLFVFAIIITAIRRTRTVGLIFLITIVILAIAVMYLKPLIGRPVPPYQFSPALKLPENFGIEGDSLGPLAAGFSYPSGHMSRATALAFLVGYFLYRRSRTAGYAMWAFPVMIGITRVYVQQHYPTDLVGGFLIGVIISVVLANAMKIWQPFQMSRFKGKEDHQQKV